MACRALLRGLPSGTLLSKPKGQPGGDGRSRAEAECPPELRVRVPPAPASEPLLGPEHRATQRSGQPAGGSGFLHSVSSALLADGFLIVAGQGCLFRSPSRGQGPPSKYPYHPPPQLSTSSLGGVQQLRRDPCEAEFVPKVFGSRETLPGEGKAGVWLWGLNRAPLPPRLRHLPRCPHLPAPGQLRAQPRPSCAGLSLWPEAQHASAGWGTGQARVAGFQGCRAGRSPGLHLQGLIRGQGESGGVPGISR